MWLPAIVNKITNLVLAGKPKLISSSDFYLELLSFIMYALKTTLIANILGSLETDHFIIFSIRKSNHPLI